MIKTKLHYIFCYSFHTDLHSYRLRSYSSWLLDSSSILPRSRLAMVLTLSLLVTARHSRLEWSHLFPSAILRWIPVLSESLNLRLSLFPLNNPFQEIYAWHIAHYLHHVFWLRLIIIIRFLRPHYVTKLFTVCDLLCRQWRPSRRIGVRSALPTMTTVVSVLNRLICENGGDKNFHHNLNSLVCQILFNSCNNPELLFFERAINE
jgi:hypothetical protein